MSVNRDHEEAVLHTGPASEEIIPCLLDAMIIRPYKCVACSFWYGGGGLWEDVNPGGGPGSFRAGKWHHGQTHVQHHEPEPMARFSRTWPRSAGVCL